MLLSDKDVATRLGIARAQVWRLAVAGRITALRIGPGTTRFDSAEVGR